MDIEKLLIPKQWHQITFIRIPILVDDYILYKLNEEEWCRFYTSYIDEKFHHLPPVQTNTDSLTYKEVPTLYI